MFVHNINPRLLSGRDIKLEVCFIQLKFENINKLRIQLGSCRAASAAETAPGRAKGWGVLSLAMKQN